MIADLIEKHLSRHRAKNVFDVGPGYGDFARVAARVTGASGITFVDCDKSVLVWQSGECKKVPIASECLCLSLEIADLAKIEGTYDVILCQEVLEHLRNAEEVLAALTERMADGGLIVITVPTKKSERWLKSLNPDYMRNEPFGHVREFDEDALRSMLTDAGLDPVVFIPTQPHCFVSHTWLYGSRMKVDGSTGRVITKGVRGLVWKHLGRFSKFLFELTGPEWWGRLLPRNYFVVAAKRRGAALERWK